MTTARVLETLSPEALASGDSWTWRLGKEGLALPGDKAGAPSPEEIEARFDSARRPVLRERARIGIASIILITIVFLAVTVVAGLPFGWAPQAVRLANMAVIVTAWAYLGRDRSVETIEHVTLAAVAFSCICAGVVCTLEGNPLNAALGLLAVSLGSATFLPWRTRMQVALVSISALALAGNVLALRWQLHFSDAITAVTIAGTFLVTVYMAHILQDVRRRGIVDDLLRRRAEENLRIANEVLEDRVAVRTAEVRAAMHELETFNYSVSHDLRSPLRVIHGMAQLIEEEFPGRLDELSADRLVRVKLATRRLGELMDAILARSRVSQAEMRPADVDLAALGDSLMAELRADNPERDVVWTRPDRLTATGDATLLRLVLENLLDNAWKFTRAKQGARIELGVTGAEGHREFHVRDNGVGFDKKHAPRLFENFQRFHGDEYEGHGIGLAMVRRIVERHGGTVRADTEPGSGTTIFFTLAEARGPRDS